MTTFLNPQKFNIMGQHYKYDIFISYSRKDISVADRICAALEKQRISYFIDRRGVGGGMEFPSVLAEAIQNSKMMLFLASRNSYDSKFTKKEVTFAFNEKPSGCLLPYIIDNSDLPTFLRFTFSDINIRTMEEHPIETVLMQDLCQLLGYTYKTDEDLRNEKMRAEEDYRNKMEHEYQERLRKTEQEYKKKLNEQIQQKESILKEEINKVKKEFGIVGNHIDNESIVYVGNKETTNEIKEDDTNSNRDSWFLIAFVVPLLTLGIGIWYGIKLDSFWTGFEIFVFPGWSGFWLCCGLGDNKNKGKLFGVGLALLGVSIVSGIHSGMFFDSAIIGISIGFVLSAFSLYIANKGL